jgi:hypothetical protein
MLDFVLSRNKPAIHQTHASVDTQIRPLMDT